MIRKWLKLYFLFNHDSPLTVANDGENTVVMDNFGKTKMSGFDNNSNGLNHSVSDSEDSVDFRSQLPY